MDFQICKILGYLGPSRLVGQWNVGILKLENGLFSGKRSVECRDSTRILCVAFRHLILVCWNSRSWVGMVEFRIFRFPAFRFCFQENNPEFWNVDKVFGIQMVEFEAGIPESFNVLVKELHSLGLNVELKQRSV